MNRGGSASHGEAAAPAEAKPTASTYYALENLIVNLSDTGGERVAQIGIVLDVDGEKTVNDIKAVLPVVRNRVLLLASQRTAEELLKRDGKEKLAVDIAAEVSRALGLDVPAPPAKAAKGEAATDEAPPRKAKAAGPIRGVLFSSFIVQ
ncbi:MAG: flagellar basal body-associated FliL family protein [Variovorax sp.]|nr:MAG: flagellar basal body-associated FliL family protein [Variovorax sp.]